MTRIIVALDDVTFNQAREKGTLSTLAQACEKEMIWGVKVSDMLYSGDVTKIISTLKDEFKLGIMADVKLHDIPSTMENSINKLVGAGANIVTIHCSSNYRPKNAGLLKYIAGIMALTSFTDLEIKWIYDRPHEEIIRALNDIGYQGPLSVEWEDCGMDRENGAKEACEFVKKIDFEPSRVAFDAAFDKAEQAG